MKLLSTLKETGLAIEKSLIGEDKKSLIGEDKNGNMDILTKLKKEHREVAILLSKLVDSESSVERKNLLKKIKMALVLHARAEEKVVYNAILSKKGKKEKIDGEEGYIEHELIDKLLLTLSKISDAMSPEFSAASKVLKEVVEHHVSEEESNIWEDVKKHFDGDERIALNRKFETMKRKVKV